MVFANTILCDCYGCKNKSTWKTLVGNAIINICEPHNTILRTKVPQDINIETNIDILKWLLNQPANPRKVVKFGIHIIGIRTVRGF